MKRLFLVGIAAIASPVLAEAPVTQPTTAPAYMPGLAVSIYKLTRTPEDIVKISPGRAPDAVWSIPSLKARAEDFHGVDRNFQAGISGEFLATAGGDYQFDVVSDDGLNLKLDGAIIVSDRWTNGVARHSYATSMLDEGWHKIQIDYYQSDRAMGFAIRMKPPGAADYVDVPATSLRVRRDALDAALANVGKAEDVAAAKPWRPLFKSKGFSGLTKAEAAIALEMLEGPTAVSKAAREESRKLGEATNYDKLSESQQTMVLSGFLHGWLYYSTDRPQPTTRAAYTMSDPEPLEHFTGWAGADRHGVKCVLTIDGRTIDIFMPTTDVEERDNVPKAVAGLPYYLRQLVNTIQVEPYGTAFEFNGGHNTIWVRLPGPATLKPLDDVFVHEAGHLLMNKTGCEEAWADAVARDVLSVSQYGRRHPREDFAEFVRLYVTATGDPDQLRSLRTMFPNRMQVMEKAAKAAGGPDEPAK